MFYSWTGVTWVYSVVQSILYYVGVALILLALKHISPTQNKVIRSFQVVGSYILQESIFLAATAALEVQMLVCFCVSVRLTCYSCTKA